ncbi:MAG: efflux RND transporter periplasmic adaptor subunit [Candidatus Eutrophobiaceae bacterium]
MANKPELAPDTQPLPPPRVLSVPVTRQDVQSVSVITGKLQAAQSAQLRFEVSGRVTQRLIEPGQSVVQDEPLLQIEADDYRSDLAIRKARLLEENAKNERDRHLLELLRKKRELEEAEVARISKLGTQSLASESRLGTKKQALIQLQSEERQLQYSVDTAASRLRIAKEELGRAERRLERTTLRAPFSGTVSMVSIHVGDVAMTNQNAAVLLQVEHLDLSLAAPRSLLPYLKNGQRIDIDIDGQIREAHIVALDPQPNPNTYTHELRLRIEGAGFFPGQLAKAHLPGKVWQAATVIPITAISLEETRYFVYKIQEETLVKTPIKILARQGDIYAISGIEPGERIVLRDISTLADNQRVQVEPALPRQNPENGSAKP